MVKEKSEYIKIGNVKDPKNKLHGSAAILQQCAKDLNLNSLKIIEFKVLKGRQYKITVATNTGIERTGIAGSKIEAVAAACAKF